MRNHLRFRPDPFDYSLLAGVHNGSAGDISSRPESDPSLSQIACTLSVSGGALSTDLALDLVLHEIAEQVRLSTGASGVAIALTRSSELVCRATTGSAPDLGERLNPYSGLSGLCLRTRTVQRCDDTETDSRVDSAACRNLRVRSILIAPVVLVENGDAIGLLEAFSADPDHFRDRDAETLLSFCTRIVHTVQSAGEAAKTPKPGGNPRTENIPASQQLVPSALSTPKSQLWDRWTMVLTTAVIAVALLLGWMIGLSDKHKVAIQNSAHLGAKAQKSFHSQKVQSEPPATAAANSVVPASHTSNLSESKKTQEENASGGLIVYQNGKVVFREIPHLRSQSVKGKPKSTREADTASGIIPSAIIPAGKTELLTPESADQYVTYRVQPGYPEAARREHIQGTVSLKVLVGKDGGVQQVQVVSGDQKLASAAADAVVQWRFKPFLLSGRPAEFQTQVTVNFKLP